MTAPHKSCPFCGYTDSRLVRDDNGWELWIECNSCGATAGRQKSWNFGPAHEAAAWMEWDTRAWVYVPPAEAP